MKKICLIILSIFIMFTLAACSKENVKMVVKDGKITIENEYVLASFNESNGSINTIYNKTQNLLFIIIINN